MDQRIEEYIRNHPDVVEARYKLIKALDKADIAGPLTTQDWWERSKYFRTKPRYDIWLDSLDTEDPPRSRYSLQQAAPAAGDEIVQRRRGTLVEVTYPGLDKEALAAFWEDTYPDLPTFVAADAIPWLEENPRFNLLTKNAFIRRLVDMGASLGDAREAWRDSRVRRVRQHFRTTQTRIIRAQMPQLQLAIVAPPGFYQADVFEMETEGKSGEEDTQENAEAFSHMALVMIEIYSRKAFVKPILDKSAETIKTAVEAVIQEITAENQSVQAIYGDNDFRTLQQFCDDNGIYLHTFVSWQTHNAGNRGGDPLGIINSFARTFKHFVRVYMIAQKVGNWVEVLPEVLAYYNEEHYHSELGGLTPDHVFDFPESIADIVRDKLDRNDAIKNLRVQRAGKRITDQEILAIIGQKKKLKRAVAASLEVGDRVLVLAPKEFKGPRKNLPEVATVKKVDVRLDRYQLAEYNDRWFQRGELYKVQGTAEDLDVSDFEKARKTLLQNKERRRGERRAEQYARAEPDVRLHDEHARLSPDRQVPKEPEEPDVRLSPDRQVPAEPEEPDRQEFTVSTHTVYPVLIPKLDPIEANVVEMGEGTLKVELAPGVPLGTIFATPGVPDPGPGGKLLIGEMLLRRINDTMFHMRFVQQFDAEHLRFAYGHWEVPADLPWAPFQEAVRQYKDYQGRSRVPDAKWVFPKVVLRKDAFVEVPVDTSDIRTGWYDDQGEFASVLVRERLNPAVYDDLYARTPGELRPSPVKVRVGSIGESADNAYKVTGGIGAMNLGSIFHLKLVKEDGVLKRAMLAFDEKLESLRGDVPVDDIMRPPSWDIPGKHEEIPGYLRYEAMDGNPLTIEAIKARLDAVGLTLAVGSSGGSRYGTSAKAKTWVVYAREEVATPLGRKPHMYTAGFGIKGDHESVESAQKAMFSLAAKLAEEAKGQQDVDVVWTAVQAVRDMLPPGSEEWEELDRALRGEDEDADVYHHNINALPKLLKKAGVSLTAPARENSWVVRLTAGVARSIGVSNVTTFQKYGNAGDKTSLESAQVALSKMGDALLEKLNGRDFPVVRNAIKAIRNCLPPGDERRQRLTDALANLP